MSNKDELTWYVNMSPFNRYLAYDIIKTVGFRLLVIGVIQFLPIAELYKEFSVDVGGVLIIVSLFRLLLKQFSSFSGISIRFVLDEKGAAMMKDDGTSGLKYVARQVSTMRWSKMNTGSFRASDSKPDVSRFEWRNISKVTEAPKRKVVTLHTKLGGFMRLFCNEDNYQDILSYVNERLNIERYVN